MSDDEVIISELENLQNRLETRADECREESEMLGQDLPGLASRQDGKAAGYDLAAAEVRRILERYNE